METFETRVEEPALTLEAVEASAAARLTAFPLVARRRPLGELAGGVFARGIAAARAVIVGCLVFLSSLLNGANAAQLSADFDPIAASHIPIGIPDSVDTLKTFVEAEGCFSPGFATFGVYTWVRDEGTGKLHTPAQKESQCTHGLAERGLLIPWSSWKAGSIGVRSDICQVERPSLAGPAQVVVSRIQLRNNGVEPRRVSLFVAVRSIGPAGWPIKSMSVEGNDALLIDGHTAVVANRKAQAIGVADTDSVASLATAGKIPGNTTANSEEGNCSGAMRFDFELAPHQAASLDVFCPVLAGRRAVGHQWAPGGNDNFKETAIYNPAEGGLLQPDPGPAWVRKLSAKSLFDEATSYWRERVGRVRLSLPDTRWAEAFAAISAHIAMNLNEGAPDVAVINYTTFNRDGMYNTQVLLEAGMNDLAQKAIDHLYAHPFNGRPYPEADNPGQILWVTAQYWHFTRDRTWLERMLPKVSQLAAIIRYYRTTPVPHWVDMNSLEFGDALPQEKRKLLEPGKCDGVNFNYTEAYDVAGLRAAATLCSAANRPQEAATWSALAEQLMSDYDRKFGSKLPKGYGSYCVLWPCRLYPLDGGPAFEQFRGIGAQPPAEWRYFAFATAHQGLLAGNRAAGHGTLERHFGHPQMQGWYAFDEGPFSGEGGWKQVRTNWKANRAMPHGWAVGEISMLLRDSLAVEDGECLVLLGGVPAQWFTNADGMRIEKLPTHFGPLGMRYQTDGRTVTLRLDRSAKPPGGFILRWPSELKARFTTDGKSITPAPNGDIQLPPNTRQLKIQL